MPVDNNEHQMVDDVSTDLKSQVTRHEPNGRRPGATIHVELDKSVHRSAIGQRTCDIRTPFRYPIGLRSDPVVS